tara:strand:+ start:2561 stop:2758 length:198 start_codon:yes stop_codon:yes gene_type:complete
VNKMTVQELIDALNTVKDKSLSVRVLENNLDNENFENYWLHSIEVSQKGQSGYELYGEVRLIGEE